MFISFLHCKTFFLLTSIFLSKEFSLEWVFFKIADFTIDIRKKYLQKF